jgi:iron complex outermembrane receptor protein
MMTVDIPWRSRARSGAALSSIVLGASLFSFAGIAQAQTTDGTEERRADQQTVQDRPSDIVVTGTLIRGVAPAGSNTISVSDEDISLSGVIDSNALLTTLVPQSEGFMDVGMLQPGRGGNNTAGLPRVPVVRPSLRNLGDSFQGSGSPTLVLLDGHRIVPAGVEQSVVDVGVIPSGILERTEIVLDGTSAVYGSDAVGGTINYIPRKRFDETRVAVTYGAADDYYSVSADVTTGVNWEGGGIGFGYSFGKNSDLLIGDREWTIPRNYLEGGHLTSLACDGYGHITIGARRFITTTLEEGTDWCELGYATSVQELERHSGFVTFSQDLTERLRFELDGFYSQRTAHANGGPFTSSVRVPVTNPYFRSIPGVPDQTQTVAFSWGPVFGNEAQDTTTKLRIGQVSPTLLYDLGGDWQVRLMGSYGKSKVTVDQQRIDTALVNTLVNGTTSATAINPYDIAATQQQTLFGSLLWNDLRDGIHTFYQARTVADGPLFSMPGGEVRVAIGAEWNKTKFKRRVTDASTHIRGDYTGASVSNEALFAEVNVPFFGPENAMPGVQALNLSVSGRYDHYSRTGGTFNPKVAATYKPVDWASIRGSWGKSFRAPNAVDRLGASANVLQCSAPDGLSPGCRNIGNFFSVPDGAMLDPTRPNVILSLSGTNPELKPETSTNWSIGADIRPPVVPGLTLSATYFNIKFRNQIRFPPININDAIAGAPDTVFVNPTPAEIDGLASLAPGGETIAQFVRDSGYNVVYVRDFTITNLAETEVSGLDATANYTYPTGFGSIDATFNGTWQLTNRVKATPGAPAIDQLRIDTPIFRMSASLGATVGNFLARVTLQHRSGFDVDPEPTRDPSQTHIASYQIVNTAFRYNVNGSGPLAQNLALTLVINNVLDDAPPISRTTSGSSANGSTLGRFVQFGIEKAF